jgi:hypothetical protein
MVWAKDSAGTVNRMEEGRKRVLGIIAGILVARHRKTTKICTTAA